MVLSKLYLVMGNHHQLLSVGGEYTKGVDFFVHPYLLDRILLTGHGPAFLFNTTNSDSIPFLCILFCVNKLRTRILTINNQI